MGCRSRDPRAGPPRLGPHGVRGDGGLQRALRADTRPWGQAHRPRGPRCGSGAPSRAPSARLPVVPPHRARDGGRSWHPGGRDGHGRQDGRHAGPGRADRLDRGARDGGDRANDGGLGRPRRIAAPADRRDRRRRRRRGGEPRGLPGCDDHPRHPPRLDGPADPLRAPALRRDLVTQWRGRPRGWPIRRLRCSRCPRPIPADRHSDARARRRRDPRRGDVLDVQPGRPPGHLPGDGRRRLADFGAGWGPGS